MKADEQRNTDPKKNPQKNPAEQQPDKLNNPSKQENGDDEDPNRIGEGLDDEDFDEFDENGGDDDFRDKLKKNVEKGESKKDEEQFVEEDQSLKGIEGTDYHITNTEHEIVNKKGQ